MINRSKAIATVDRRSFRTTFISYRPIGDDCFSGAKLRPAAVSGKPLFSIKRNAKESGGTGRKKVPVQLLICKAGKPVTG